MAELALEIRGLQEAQAKVDQVITDLHGRPMLNAMRDAAVIVANDAKSGAPVDTGQGRASITPEVRLDRNDVIGVVGSNQKQMLFMEVGTKPHWPPPGALAGWARRHGVDEFIVARAIARRGTKPRKFFEKAFEKNEKRIREIIDDAVSQIASD